MKRIVLSLSILIVGLAQAQLGLNFGFNTLKFNGDVGRKNNSNFLYDARAGYSFGVEYKLKKILAVGLTGMYGRLQGTDNSRDSRRNFLSTIMGGELSVGAYFDKKNDTLKPISPFVSVGIGYMMFDPKGDLKDKYGDTYHYWSDGSTRNLAESSTNDPISTVLSRDYSYETSLKDSTTSYSKSCMYLPINLGAKIQMGYRTNVRLAVNYNLAFSDYIDNYKNGGNDSWFGANITFNVVLGKKPHTIYSNIDFTEIDESDYDKDGVKDNHDQCLGTPKGVPVDGHGCPLDSDHDRVPDYMDKEPNTAKDAITDGWGVTITVDEIAKKQKELDELFGGRSDEDYSSPK